MSMRPFHAALVALALAVPALATAAVPGTLQIAGTLGTQAGGPATDGTYTLTFSLYPEATATKALWTEAAALAVQGGTFWHALASKTPLTPDVLAAPQLWLGVQIGSEPELPRKQLLSVAFSLRSQSAEGVDCSGCIGLAQLDPKVLADYAKTASLAKVATSGKYADLAGLPDLAVYAKSADLKPVATTGAYGDLSGTPDLSGFAKAADLKAVATTGAYGDLSGTPDLSGFAASNKLAGVAFTGKYADLNGLQPLAQLGKACGTGLVVKGLKADGSLECIAALDPTALPPDGLSPISNGLLTDQFTDVFTSPKVPVAILDNTPTGTEDTLVVPDLGLVQKLSVQVDLTNSDLQKLEVDVFAPDNTKYVLYDKATKGTVLKGSWPDKNAVLSGDLGTWVGKNPKGTWRLLVTDTGFLDNKTDGQVNAWSVTLQTLSSKKVQANGLFITAGGLQLQTATAHPVTCDGSHFGYLYANTKDKVIYVCNGKDFFPMSLTVPGTQDNPAVSCKDILAKIPGSKDGLYWIDPDGPGATYVPYQTWCDMTTAGGGWTLVFQRRNGNSNHESFGSNLNDFVQTKGGNPNKLGYDDSFSVGMGNRPQGVKEWLFLDYDSNLVVDSDDAFILGYDQNLFPNSAGGNDIAVTSVCNINNANCDTTNVYFKWFGNNYFGSSVCSSGVSSGYGGNYGYCHNGLGNYDSNSLFGNRQQYNETKLWDYNVTGYMERVFVR